MEGVIGHLFTARRQLIWTASHGRWHDRGHDTIWRTTDLQTRSRPGNKRFSAIPSNTSLYERPTMNN